MISIKSINAISTENVFLCNAAYVLKGATEIQNKPKMAECTFNY